VKWFTREWQSGGLPDEEWELVVPAYWRHVEETRPRLVGRADALPDVNLHDGLVLDVAYLDDRFSWSLCIGDRQVGYEVATLTYVGARLANVSAAELDAMDLPGRTAEVLYDEVDVAGDDVLHRVLFWPTGELHIAFHTMSVDRRPTSTRQGS
jgi:hypothetical protein